MLGILLAVSLILIAPYLQEAMEHRSTSYQSFTAELLGTLGILTICNVYDNVYQADIVVG